MLRVITLNLNGIRSAFAKGFSRWLARQRADCVCMQEIKAHKSDLPNAILMPRGVCGHFHFAEKKGYSGVAMYCRSDPDAVSTGFGSREFDPEARWLRADFGRLSVVSLYLPSGTTSAARQEAKFRFLDEFLPVLRKLAASGREFILCGDWNIAHKEIDLKNWRGNRKNSGFLPEEREWLTRVFDELAWVDVFRLVDVRAEQYTWWSNRGRAWAKNVGWRIDYQIGTPRFARTAKRVAIYKKERFSDHAPLTINYDYPLA